MSALTQIVAAAEQFGWTPNSNNTEQAMVWRKEGPMIDRRDQHRLALTFSSNGMLLSANYGPSNRKSPLVRAGRPRSGDVVAHLLKYGPK